MSTATLASKAPSRPRMPAAAISATLALVLGFGLAAAVLLSQPPASPALYADGYANLAGMGGLANPATRQMPAVTGYQNLAGMGGLANPATRQMPAVTGYQNLAGMGGLANPAPRD
jgi:hypothetical protein